MSIKAEAAKMGLCISMQKTKTMEAGENTVKVDRCVIDGKEYRRVDYFVCLGSTISGNGQLTKEAKERIGETSGSFFHLWNI